MLMITKRQWEIFGEYVRAQFIRSACDSLREEEPKFLEGLDDEMAFKRVEECVAKAESYGFTTERQVLDFIDIQTIAGVDFDVNPRFARAREVLTDLSREPNHRLSRARRRVLEELARRGRG